MCLVGRGAPWPLERLLCLSVKADLEDFEDCVGEHGGQGDNAATQSIQLRHVDEQD